jgi:hypothetical protein
LANQNLRFHYQKQNETKIDPPSPEAQLDIPIKDDKKKESYSSSSSAESKKKTNS